MEYMKDSEMIGKGGFLLSEERQEIHDRLQQMTLEEKVDFLEKYEEMRSKDPLEKTISPVDARLREILLEEQCGKIWADIRSEGLEPDDILVKSIARLNALTGKENKLGNIMKTARDIQAKACKSNLSDAGLECMICIDHIIEGVCRQKKEKRDKAAISTENKHKRPKSPRVKSR